MAIKAGALGSICFLLFICLSRAAPSTDSVLGQILSSEYTGLVKLLEQANLLSELESDESFSKGVTIFAPSDLSLSDKSPGSLLDFLTQPGNIEYLRKVLLHHIVPGKVNVKSWYPGETVQTFAGSDANLYLEEGDLKVSGVAVKELGVLEGPDGIVHGMHGLLVPEDVKEALSAYEAATEVARRGLTDITTAASAPAPSPSADLASQLTDALQANGNFSVLLSLLDDLGLLPEISSLLDSGRELSLFAPDNDAFSSVNLTSLSGSDVSNVLLYHVAYGSYTFDELLAIGNGSLVASTSRRLLQSSSGLLYTVNNSTITVSNVNGAAYVNNVQVLNPDLLPSTQLSVQGISAVLIPPTAIPSPSPVTASPPPPASAGLKVVGSVLSLVLAMAGLLMVA